MRRETQNVLLLLVGGAMVKISVDGSFLRYVKPSLHPYLLASGIFIVGLAVVAIVRDVRRGGPADDDHAHSSRPYWMLLLPAALILFVAPPALDVSSVSDRVVAAGPVQRTAFPPLPDGEAPEVSLLDVVQRAARDSTGSLDDREITVTGIRVENPDGSVDLARILIICCAADARSIRIHLDRDVEGEWLRVRGTVGESSPETGNIPTMTVTGVEQIDEPENTYAY
ncbi:TIGR03943 family protein [Rhodococcus sp. 14-2470-1b]|uniref:TIGR03943 family putative permease subunit n=1 Tax=unclassified Rhodococcus (in: high G+C Gram-positive bacteria) TaxID=192944 RepID=UPI00036D9E66|nr:MULTISPECIES: TIGR03943 family protein [unclassified Rhodococcus (in: high G+C Gram-positive bacteria)]OZF55926.1 TIGR03943 family protein [Rhodococcus sp. 14-2470-1b]